MINITSNKGRVVKMVAEHPAGNKWFGKKIEFTAETEWTNCINREAR